ncbi:NAD(P)(+)--arginine ADP-ribosyltransferase 2-like [Ambystoma mexicanum]|uniref:NAD(P)(+)--arginine ADP-ribosyltransferase 2-like n=1 Tax=Ambystoma mexicanum TaxID=8296 RepID=UPI0037E76515
MWHLQTLTLLLTLATHMESRLTIDPSDDQAPDDPFCDSIPMTIAAASFDDRYNDCEVKMEKNIQKLLTEDMQKNALFKKCWKEAEGFWRENKYQVYDPKVKDFYAIAIAAYTSEDCNLYKPFNDATRAAGQSFEEYQKYHFKAFHFLLTRAATLLHHWPRRTLYRGAGPAFSAQEGNIVRFGHFTSSSFKRSVAEEFMIKTIFIIKHSEYGFPVKKFSMFVGEEEVLIPPYELFRVLSVLEGENNRNITITSDGQCSNWNCALLNGRKGKSDCPDHTVLFL